MGENNALQVTGNFFERLGRGDLCSRKVEIMNCKSRSSNPVLSDWKYDTGLCRCCKTLGLQENQMLTVKNYKFVVVVVVKNKVVFVLCLVSIFASRTGATAPIPLDQI